MNYAEVPYTVVANFAQVLVHATDADDAREKAIAPLTEELGDRLNIPGYKMTFTYIAPSTAQEIEGFEFHYRMTEQKEKHAQLVAYLNRPHD